METKAKILANDGISENGKEKLEKAGFYVSTDNVSQDQLAEVINKENYEVLLVRSATKVRQPLIDACPNLKLIGRGGVGLDNIDVEYARNKGIEVINTPGASAQSVAELAIAHMFSLLRFLYDSNRQMPILGHTNFKELKKKYSKGIELREKTLGIIGFGRIGQCVAEYALGIGMKIKAYDPFIERATINININGTAKASIGIVTGQMSELLQESDIITIHVPKQNNGAVIGAAEFAQMKDGVFIINTARGGVIDESALLENLNNGKVAAAALDVFENEPTPNEELLKHPKISLSPHIGAATIEAQSRIGVELADKIISYFKKNLKR